MTITSPDLASLLERDPEALRTAAQTAARQLPSSGPDEVDEPRPLTEPLQVLAGLSARAVTVDVTGAAPGSVALVVAGTVADAVQEGPLGAADLVTALGGAVTDAVATFEPAAGGPLEVGVADAVEAQALSFGPAAIAVPLLDEGAVFAVFVVELALPEPVLEPEPASAEDAPEFTPFVEQGAPPRADRSLELLHDVEMAVTVELGRTRMAVADLLGLAPGAVVELDRAAGSPVDVLVNGKLIARGEVVVVDEDFGIRISEIIGLQRSAH